MPKHRIGAKQSMPPVRSGGAADVAEGDENTIGLLNQHNNWLVMERSKGKCCVRGKQSS